MYGLTELRRNAWAAECDSWTDPEPWESTVTYNGKVYDMWFLDLEGTGFFLHNKSTSAKIVEIGLCKADETFGQCWRVRPPDGCTVVPDIHKLQDSDIENAPPIGEVWSDIRKYIQRRSGDKPVMFLHHSQYDLRVLQDELNAGNMPCDTVFIDTVWALKSWLKEKGQMHESVSLPILSELFNINFPAHCALGDAYTLRAILQQLVGTETTAFVECNATAVREYPVLGWRPLGVRKEKTAPLGTSVDEPSAAAACSWSA
eukprot:TRINITY_DN68192_c4_g4_i1.p1 TRINITY_DN68192_c4_g4~~TRINITY_DN68192_c4_g4_i1.p1  ORF type:complete len:289 (-),score=8.83 TRINITY_DN68192_c4_g4_i1:385-1161(-)